MDINIPRRYFSDQFIGELIANASTALSQSVYELGKFDLTYENNVAALTAAEERLAEMEKQDDPALIDSAKTGVSTVKLEQMELLSQPQKFMRAIEKYQLDIDFWANILSVTDPKSIVTVEYDKLGVIKS